MKLKKKTENLKLPFVNNIHTSTSQKNIKRDSDIELAEKITQILNIYEKVTNFKGKPSFKNWCIYCGKNGYWILSNVD